MIASTLVTACARADRPRRRHGSPGRAHDRLGDEGRDRVRTEPLKFGLELRGKPRDEIAFGLIVVLFVIGESRRDMAEGR